MLDFKGVVYYQTNTWPDHGLLLNDEAHLVPAFARYLYPDGVFCEIERLLGSREFPGGSYVGHMTLIAICCAIDSVAAFADGAERGAAGVRSRFLSFVTTYFPKRYASNARDVFELLRCDGVHEWYLQRATISSVPNDPKHLTGSLYVSLPDLFRDLRGGFESYAQALERDAGLRTKFLARYRSVR